jgi:hypothetical protein
MRGLATRRMRRVSRWRMRHRPPTVQTALKRSATVSQFTVFHHASR